MDSWNNNEFRKYIKDIYNSEIDIDYLLKNEEVFSVLMKKSLIKNKDKIDKDPYVNTYLLLKSMKWVWTNKEVVNWIFDNYNWDWVILEKIFWTPGGESLMERLHNDYMEHDIEKLLQSKLDEAKNK